MCYGAFMSARRYTGLTGAADGGRPGWVRAGAFTEATSISQTNRVECQLCSILRFHKISELFQRSRWYNSPGGRGLAREISC